MIEKKRAKEGRKERKTEIKKGVGVVLKISPKTE